MYLQKLEMKKNDLNSLPRYLTDNMLHNGQLKAELNSTGKSDTSEYARRTLCLNMWIIEQTGAKVVCYDTDSLYTDR